MEDVKKEVISTALFYGIDRDGQRGSENPANLLSSVLADRHVITFQELRLLSAKYLRKTLASILSKISSAGGAASDATHYKHLSTASS